MLTFRQLRNASAAVVAAVAIAGIAGNAVTAASAASTAPVIKSASTMKVDVRGGSLTFVNVRRMKSFAIGDEIVLTQPASPPRAPRR